MDAEPAAVRSSVDPDVLTGWGLPGLFLVAFLAGSVVPLPSEAVIVALVGGGVGAEAIVPVATAGNLLGAGTLYWLGSAAASGRGGRPARALLERMRRDPARYERARARLRRYGAPLLVLSWVPIAGDAFVIAAGFAGVRALPFLCFTAIGKGLRFAAVAGAARAALGGP